MRTSEVPGDLTQNRHRVGTQGMGNSESQVLPFRKSSLGRERASPGPDDCPEHEQKGPPWTRQVGWAGRVPVQHSAPPQGSQRLAPHGHSDGDPRQKGPYISELN